MGASVTAPTLSPSERARLSATIATIDAAQAKTPTGQRFRQARSGRETEIEAVGIQRSEQASGRALGAKIDVDEYDGPLGRGYVVEVRLVRDGVTWGCAHQVGPETWRAHDWQRMSGPVVI